MKVLVACEESQRVCTAFREKGHESYSCDIIECSGGHSEWHIMQDVLPLLNGNCSFKTMDGVEHQINGQWDLIIAHPPCTYLSKASACRMYRRAGQIDDKRYEEMMKARSFFIQIMNSDCDRICIENPRPLKIAQLPKPTQIIQPYEFDEFQIHPFSKETLLWLIGLKELNPTTPNNKCIGTWIPSNTGGFSRGRGGGKGASKSARERSKTFIGIAAAMADQWGGLR